MKDRTQALQGKASGAKDQAMTKAAQAGDRLKDATTQVQGRATDAAHRVQESTPQPVLDAAATVAKTGRRHPGPLLAVGAGALLAVGVLRKRRNGRG